MTTGVPIANIPGSIISFKEAFVEISTHLSYSGLAFPFIIPGISLNCLLTSKTISIAALPTAFIAKAEKTTGTIPPINNIARTGALKMLIPSIPVNVTYAANNASEVNAADAIANPLPVAAVVLPTESSISVLSLTIGFCPLISATPPALSEIGPKASIANCIPVVAIMAEADKATP